MITDELLHGKILATGSEISKWFQNHRQGLAVPIYSSFDIRDSGFKVAPVDANIFPAGFNNICQVDRDEAVDIMDQYLNDHYEISKKILLISEEHTGNPYYWSNIKALVDVIHKTNRQVMVGIPGSRTAPLKTKSVEGFEFEVKGAERVGDEVDLDGFRPDVVVSNNDFSVSYGDWAMGLRTPMNPPHKLGWFSRRKNDFFDHYNHLATEFCEILQLDPWHFRVETRVFSDFDPDDLAKRERLAQVTQELLAQSKNEAKRHGSTAPSFAVVKNNAGTYGLGVTMVQSGEDIINWNYKSRKTMKAAKGGREINEVIIQEGIPTRFVEDGVTAEPAIYMIGCQLAGGFLRTHSEKGPMQNLNSPGAVYKRLCVTDLKSGSTGLPMENVYGWVAKLALLAISFEAHQKSIEFLGYKTTPSC